MNEAAQTQTGYLDVEGGRLYYEVAGNGHPLVFIHAGVADHSMWDEQWDCFARHYRVIRYDTRAFGRSKTEDVPFSNRQDLYDLLKHLGVEKTYVVGLSRGGQIAGDFTVEHPEMVDALIVVAGGVSGFQPEPTEDEKKLWEEDEALWQEGKKTGDWSKMAEFDVRLWADGPGQPEGRAPASVRDRVRQMCINNYSTHSIEGQPIVLDPPAFGRLSEVKAPTLVVVGDLDGKPVQQAMHALAKNVQGARLIVFPGVAHMVNMEKPDEFNSLVLDFLQSL